MDLIVNIDQQGDVHLGIMPKIVVRQRGQEESKKRANVRSQI